MEEEKAVHPKFTRIKSLSHTSDEELDLFSKTPIYGALQRRRIIARKIVKDGLFLNSAIDVEMFDLIEDNIKQYLLI